MAKKSLIAKPDEKKLPAELTGIIIGPRITEKAAYSAEKTRMYLMLQLVQTKFKSLAQSRHSTMLIQ
jgi:hypothetical protein